MMSNNGNMVLGRSVAREISQEEVDQVSGGVIVPGATGHTASTFVMKGGDVAIWITADSN